MSIIKDFFSKKQKPDILVRDVTLQRSGASREFTYTAPALSVNILKLAKK